MKNINKKLDVLVENNIISPEIKDDVNNYLNKIYEETNLERNEENYSMFALHSAMALKRINDNEEVDEIPNELYENVKNDPNYERAKKLLKTLEEDCGCNVSRNEIPYFEMHLLNMVNKIND